MTITLITCTGDRHICFALLERWISAQTYTGSIRWIVLDDGEYPVRPTMGQHVVRMEPMPVVKRQPHPMPQKIMHAIDHDLLGDVNLVIEDDDYYAPGYIEHYANLLSQYDVVGETQARYYHVPQRMSWRHQNPNHASLAQTGFRGSVIPQLRSAITEKPDPFIDLRLWANAQREGYDCCLFNDAQDELALFVGFKAMPGRGGAGGGHQVQGGYRADSEWQTLQKWCPRDWRTYAELHQGE